MRDLIKRETIEGALTISVLCTILTLPHLWYLCFVGMRKTLKGLEPQFFVVHLWCILVISFLCGAFGLAWSRGCGLGGIVNGERFRRNIPLILIFSFVVGAGSFLISDIHLSTRIPYLYPSSPIFSLMIPLKAAFFNEVIRFGGMALVARLSKSIHLSNIIISIFFLYTGISSLRLVGIDYTLEDWMPWAIGWSLLVNLGMGYMYARIGILSTMVVQFVAGLRLLLFIR
jgi:hypothetical protein